MTAKKKPSPSLVKGKKTPAKPAPTPMPMMPMGGPKGY
jgi:hypothetical protein